MVGEYAFLEYSIEMKQLLTWPYFLDVKNFLGA